MIGLIAGYCLILAIILGLMLTQIKQTKRLLTTGQLTRSEAKLRQLDRTADWADAITGRLVPDLRLIRTTTDLSQSLLPALADFDPSISRGEPIDLTDWVPVLQAWADRSETMLTDLDQSWLIAKWLEPEALVRIETVGQKLADATPTLTDLLSRQTKVLVVLQNRNELRAGGGFMGSYLLLTLDRGRVTDLDLEDIYDADGQFFGFVPAPTGVAEYLSSDRGLRLPDANWSSEFSQAGPTILSYFSLGKRTDIDLLIAINQRPLAQLLAKTGPLPLPDYQTELTPDNLDQVLQDRGEFFPGSRAKTQLLSSALTQLQAQVASGRISTDLLTEIASQAVLKKDILFFSPHPSLQRLLSELQLTGDIAPSRLVPPLYLLESNVGINKINPWIKRAVTLSPQSDKLHLRIDWQNTKSGQNYINYQRLVIPATWTVERVLIDGQPVSHLDQDQIELSSGLVATQVGFLVTVLSQDKTSVELELTTEPDLRQLQLIAQPGQDAYPVTIQSESTRQDVMLDRDVVVSW